MPEDLKKKNEKAPIVTGEVFSPEIALRLIRKMKPADRRLALKEFKEKLAYQRVGLAKAQAEIIQEIRTSPDQTLFKFYAWFEDAASKYGVTDSQKLLAKAVIAKYVNKHQAIRDARKKFPKTEDLFMAICGRKPKGAVEVVEGPMTICFRCRDINDYALVDSQSFLQNRQPSSEELEEAGKSGGVSIDSVLIPDLAGTIIAENITNQADFKLSEGSRRILDHEEQHAIKKLFDEVISNKEDIFNLNTELDLAVSDGEWADLLRRYFRYVRGFKADSLAGDEILAFFKQGASSGDVISHLIKPGMTDKVRSQINELESFSGDNEVGREVARLKEKYSGLYDYLGDFEPYLDLAERFRPMAKTIMEEVFINEYHQLIEDGTWAVYELSGAGYSKDQIIAMLIDEPLDRWKKIASRLG